MECNQSLKFIYFFFFLLWAGAKYWNYWSFAWTGITVALVLPYVEKSFIKKSVSEEKEQDHVTLIHYPKLTGSSGRARAGQAAATCLLPVLWVLVLFSAESSKHKQMGASFTAQRTTSEMILEIHVNPINSVAASAKMALCFHSNQNPIEESGRDKKLLCPAWDILKLSAWDKTEFHPASLWHVKKCRSKIGHSYTKEWQILHKFPKWAQHWKQHSCSNTVLDMIILLKEIHRHNNALWFEVIYPYTPSMFSQFCHCILFIPSTWQFKPGNPPLLKYILGRGIKLEIHVCRRESRVNLTLLPAAPHLTRGSEIHTFTLQNNIWFKSVFTFSFFLLDTPRTLHTMLGYLCKWLAS